MKLFAGVIATIVLTIFVGLVTAGSETTLQPGAYDVQVRLELPNLSDNTAVKNVAICIRIGDAQDNAGLAVLSDNNPLAKCPHSNNRVDGNELFFDIECPGGNSARGSARYILGAASFTGRIKMNMGGKNMTMTEVQAGRRVGDCATEDVH